MESGFTIENRFRVSVSGLVDRELDIEIYQSSVSTRVAMTDPQDALFLVLCDLSDGDYTALRAEQRLTVDRAGFPGMLRDLVGRYGARLTRGGDAMPGAAGDVLLEVLEQGTYKVLTHLSLAMREASERVGKHHLASCLVKERERAKAAEEEVAALKRRVADAEGAAQRGVEAAREAERASERIVADLRVAHAREREASAREAQEIAARTAERHERELSAVVRERDERYRELEARAATEAARVSDLTDRLHAAQTSLKELGHSHSSASQQLEVAQREVARLREENAAIDRELFDLRKLTQQQSVSQAALEQNVADKEDLVNRMQSLVGTTEAQKRTLEESLALMRANEQRLEAKVRACAAEINKGNDIIRRLQADAQALVERGRLKSVVCERQEALIAQREAELSQLQSKLMAAEQRSAESRLEIKELSSRLADATNKIEDLGKIISNNESVIAYLSSSTTGLSASSSAAASLTASSKTYRPRTPFSLATGGASNFSSSSPGNNLTIQGSSNGSIDAKYLSP